MATPTWRMARLLNLREAVAAFGFHLATMDVRQNSDVHERAVAELLKVAGDADYLALDEEERAALLAERACACPPAALALCRLFRGDDAGTGHRRQGVGAQSAASAKARSPIM